MAEPLVSFTWWRPRGLVKTAQAPATRFVGLRDVEDTYLLPEEGAGEFQPYKPAEEVPDLVRRLLSLNGDHVSYASFASEYGFLAPLPTMLFHELVWDRDRKGFLPYVPDFASDRPKNVRPQTIRAESSIEWEIEIHELDTAVRLFGALTARDRPAVQAQVEVMGTAVRLRGDPYEGLSRHAHRFLYNDYGVEPRPLVTRTLGKRFGVPKTANTMAAGWSLLTELINAKLFTLTSLQLLPVATGHLHSPRIGACPRSLLGFAWFLLAEDVDQGRSPRRCRRCAKWFVLHPRSKRRHDQYCSDACRMAFHRKRKRARELKAEGRPVSEIARRVQVDLNTVRQWVRRR